MAVWRPKCLLHSALFIASMTQTSTCGTGPIHPPWELPTGGTEKGLAATKPKGSSAVNSHPKHVTVEKGRKPRPLSSRSKKRVNQYTSIDSMPVFLPAHGVQSPKRQELLRAAITKWNVPLITGLTGTHNTCRDSENVKEMWEDLPEAFLVIWKLQSESYELSCFFYQSNISIFAL